MTTLNLFPARIAFVNPDGTLTAEAYRALTVLFARVGGPLGDNGVDVFGSAFGVANETGSLSTLQTDVVQPQSETRLLADLVQQSANFGTDFYGDVVQSPASSSDLISSVLPEVMQPVNDPNGAFATLDVSGNASIGGTLSLSAGTVALPSLYLSTNTTTGFYQIAANNIGFAVSGVKVLNLLSTGLTIGTAASAFGGIINGIGSGTGGGASMQIQNAGSPVIAIGNKSNIIGGAYSATPTIYGNPSLEFNLGGTVYGTMTTSVFTYAVALTSGGLITGGSSSFCIASSVNFANGAGAGAGTLLNAPAAGNPTKWIGINDNGTTRYIPAW